MEFLRRLARFREQQATTQTAPIRQGRVNEVGVAEVKIAVRTNGGLYRPTETREAVRDQKFQEGEVETLADTAVRGLEQVYWHIVNDLADAGSRRAAELLVTRAIMQPTSMTDELAMALGVHHGPRLSWEELLDLINERVEAYGSLRTELFRNLWCGGPGGFVDPDALDEATDKDMLDEVTRRAQSAQRPVVEPSSVLIGMLADALGYTERTKESEKPTLEYLLSQVRALVEPAQ